MSKYEFLKSRVRGHGIAAVRAELGALRAELAEQRVMLLGMNHLVHETHAVLASLNHDVRSGSDVALPLFLGYVERLRVDAETAIAATQVIERQLARLEQPPSTDHA